MSGIMMLREVIELEPTNEEALFNLGILSIQSGQYDKAIGRFETLLANHPKNEQAEFYLALSYFNDNRPEDARRLFQKIKNTSKDEQVLAAVESYLNEL
jgi:cytochrome c-type biogenesis protein CcmH/NrfG